MRRLAALVIGAAVVACGSGATSTAPPKAAAVQTDAVAAQADTDATPKGIDPTTVAWCTGKTAYLYDPAGGAGLTTFPDDFYTLDDKNTLTGLRVHFDAQADPWIASTPGAFQSTYADLSTLDGWGVSAGIILRFSGSLAALPSGPTSAQSDAILLLDLDDPDPAQPGGATRVPFEAQAADDGATAILWPMRPLKPGHKHGVVVTRKLLAKDGTCVAPSPTLKALLTGSATAPRLQRMQPRYDALLAAAGLKREDVAAATVFTTQRTWDKSVAIAANVAAGTFKWQAPMACKPMVHYRFCQGTFLAYDYRDGRVVLAGKPVKQYELKVAAWLPLGAAPPYPTIVFGHGLGSDRLQGEALGDLAAPQGIATVAIDAVFHGEHPAGHKDAKLQTVFGFFGIDVATQGVDALRLRDNWRQSTYDKLQLLQLLKQAPDLDGDGKSDAAPDKLMYLGVSLGGIMGPELAALSPDLQVVVLSVPGGRVSSIIADPSGQFAAIVYALKPEGATDGDVDRYFPVLQTLIDAGDAASYAPFVLHDRLQGAGSAIPNLLFGMVIDDDTVPNTANRALARAFAIPHAAPVLQVVGLLPDTPKTPFSGNIAGGKATAGLFQYDRITPLGAKKPEKAAHGNMPKSQEALAQDLHFVQTWLATGKAELIDPYAVLGTPPWQP